MILRYWNEHLYRISSVLSARVFPSHDSPKIIDLSSPIGFYQFISTEDPYNALAYNIIRDMADIRAQDFLSARYATRGTVIQSMQVIGIIYDVWTTSTLLTIHHLPRQPRVLS